MSEAARKQAIYYLENTILAVISVFLLFLPLFFLSATTDAFSLPKQILLTVAVALSTVLFGIKTLFEGKIKLRATPFDLPVILLVVFSLASALFAVNRTDALLGFLPFFFAIFLFFLIANAIKHPSQLLVLLASLVAGTAIASLLSVLSYFNIFLLPFPYTRVAYFNTFGSLLDQAIYFAVILPITGYFVHSIFSKLHSKRKTSDVFTTDPKGGDNRLTPVTILFAVGFFIILAGISVTVYQLATTQKPLILPLETGFQTGFASISQDSGRILWGFLLGSGPGTFITDFTRYKSAAYNLNPDLWSFTFFRSSTFMLELLATSGILTMAAFLFLLYKIIKERGFFFPLILIIVASLILPFSNTLMILFFLLLGIFSLIHAHNHPHKFHDIEFYFVALKHGLLAARPEHEPLKQNAEERKFSKFLPIFFFIFLVALIALPVYISTQLLLSDLLYQRSLVAYSENNGLQTYNLQAASISTLPRDMYYRGFSQVNLALANSLANQMRSTTPTQQDQQNLLTLIQQSIAAGKNATIVSPQTSFNWSNLSSIYRNLIGFGENADKFAILTGEQAIALDPKNPLQYIDLGGIYYQLGLYDDAIRQFQIAINLKQDYANAYYNLGHALEMKGNLNEALAAYQIVKNLVAGDAANAQKIDAEINALQAKIAGQATPTPEPIVTAAPVGEAEATTEENQPLNVNKPENQLPERRPRVSIPGPTISEVPSTTPAKTSPAPSGSTTDTP